MSDPLAEICSECEYFQNSFCNKDDEGSCLVALEFELLDSEEG